MPLYEFREGASLTTAMKPDEDTKGTSGGYDTPGHARRDLELEALIEKEPDNEEGYLVYGDWLQRQGDPRGELIALQCAAPRARWTSGEAAAQHLLRVFELTRQHRRFLLGELADRTQEELKLEWRFGFIRSVRLELDEDSDFDVAEAVRGLMVLPAARFLRQLTVEARGVSRSLDYGAAFEALSETPCPTLEGLCIEGFKPWKGTKRSRAHLRDVSVRLSKALPGLRSLRLVGAWHGYAEVDLTDLRALLVESGGLRLEDAVEPNAKAK